MKLGARIFKTGLSVMLALYLASFLQYTPATFAAIAAAFAVQPSIYRTVQILTEQIQANVIGAVLAITFGLTFGPEPFVVGIVTVIAIAIFLKLKLEPSIIPLAIVTVIIIMESPAEQFFEYAWVRFLLIMLGIVSAFIVNLVFLPPKHEAKLYHLIANNTEQINQWVMLLIRRDADRRALKKDITNLNEQFIKNENIYLLYKEERNYFIKSKLGKARKVVLFRQMLLTSKKTLNLLRQLELRENDFFRLPEPFLKMVEEHMQRLTTYHDRILLRYVGKVSSKSAEETLKEVSLGKRELTELYLELYDTKQVDKEEWLHSLPVISHMIEYQEQLEHLDRLVDSFFSFHKGANRVMVHDEE